MTNSCTCKAEHWQPHAESCPAYKPRPLLTVENIRSGAVPSDAVAVGFLLGEIEKLRAQLASCELSLRIYDDGVSEYWLRDHSHEPKACETFPGEVHPLGKLTNLICDVIEHARDSSPHSNEFEALVQTMWDEYNAKLLAQGASRDEPLKGEPFPLRSALEALLQRYVTLVNCGDCGSWNPEEEDAVIQARAALQVGTVTAQSLPEHCGQTICWMPCERHKGGTFMMTIQSGSPAIAKCPGCETERGQR